MAGGRVPLPIPPVQKKTFTDPVVLAIPWYSCLMIRAQTSGTQLTVYECFPAEAGEPVKQSALKESLKLRPQGGAKWIQQQTYVSEGGSAGFSKSSGGASLRPLPAEVLLVLESL